MWFVRFGQSMRTSQNNPDAELAGKSHNLFNFFFKQFPIIAIEIRKIRPHVAAQCTFGEMNDISTCLACLVQKFADLLRVPPNNPSHRKLAGCNF